MALTRLATMTLSCVLFLLFYSSTCIAIPVTPGTDHDTVLSGQEPKLPTGDGKLDTVAAEKGGLKRFERVAGLGPDEILFRSSAPNYNNNDKDQKITPETIEAFREYGITNVINANGQARSPEYRAALQAAGIKYTPIPVKDFSAPTQKDLEMAWDSFKTNKPGGTLVHCGYGHGRTGVVVTSIQMRSEHERGILRTWGREDYGKNYVEHQNAMKESTGQDEALNKLQAILKKEGRTASGQRCTILRKRAECYPITPNEEPLKPAKDGGLSAKKEKVVDLAEKVSAEEFIKLADERGLTTLAKEKWSLSLPEVRTSLLKYKPIPLESPKLEFAGPAMTSAMAIGPWVGGIVEAFRTDAGDLDRAAAVTAIVPFVGCSVQVAADASHSGLDKLNDFDKADIALCYLADSLLLGGVTAPLDIVVQFVRSIIQIFKAPAELPTQGDMQRARDEAWQTFLRDNFYKYLYSDGLRTKLDSSLAIESVAVLSEGAQRIGALNASSQIAVDTATSDAEKRHIQDSTLQAIGSLRDAISIEVAQKQRQVLLNLPRLLKDEATASLKATANQYNEEFIRNITSRDMIQKYSRESIGDIFLEGFSGGLATQPSDPFAEADRRMNDIGRYLGNEPPPMPDLYAIAFIVGQSTGWAVDPLTLSPQAYLKEKISGLSEEQIDMLAIRHVQDIVGLLQGEIKETDLYARFPAYKPDGSPDLESLRDFRVLLAVSLGKFIEGTKKERIDTAPAYPPIKDGLDEPGVFDILGLPRNIVATRLQGIKQGALD